LSYKISVSRWQGDDKIAVTEKIAKVFRLQPSKANDIMNNLGLGIPWRFNHTVSDQQGKEAKAFLSSLGFKVDLLPANPKNIQMGLGVNLYTNQEEFEEEPIKKSFFARVIEKIGNKST